jgi:chorismate synthase
MLVGILEGLPSGLELVASRDIDPSLAARQQGYGRGRRQQIEQDTARIVSGVRFGVTTGAPIALLLQNRDWANWKDRMSIEPVGQEDRPVTVPRPGHADLAGALKYGHERDIRNVLERASARETAMRVAIGAIAKKLLAEIGIETIAYVTAIGDISVARSNESTFPSRSAIDASPLRTAVPAHDIEMISAIDRAKKEGDTLGGVAECIIRGVPPGVGSHVHWDRKLDGLLAQAAMSIQAAKAVEIGAGVLAGQLRGSEVHDAISVAHGTLGRVRNNAGGIEGGMSNGEDIVVRAHMKPISTLMRPLDSVDLVSREATTAHIERSDVCAVPAFSVILEHVLAIAIASECLTTFGGDTLDELRARVIGRRALLSTATRHA